MVSRPLVAADGRQIRHTGAGARGAVTRQRDSTADSAERLLWRERLSALLPSLYDAHLALIVGPAGAGKTTVLTQLTEAARAPVAWCLVERADSEALPFLKRLERALVAAVPDLQGGWQDAADAADELNVAVNTRTLLVLDDFHLLHGTSAEQMLERLLKLSRNPLAVLIGTRIRPAFNLSRLRACGEVAEVGADELRFRSWEVERLFREIYREPLPPEALAALTRRTDGWAVGLHLFHLATRGKPL